MLMLFKTATGIFDCKNYVPIFFWPKREDYCPNVYFWGKFEVDSSSALGQLWITRSPLCPLLLALAWLVYERSRSPQ